MQPNRRYDDAPQRELRGVERAQNFGRELRNDDSPLAPPALLKHCAAILDAVALLLCQSQPISMAGRQVLVHIADRLRRVAEVIR